MPQKLPQNEWFRRELAQSRSASKLPLEEFTNPSAARIAVAIRGVVR